MSSEKSYIQLYTGDGRGKTSAAIGLAVRAAALEKRVFIAQFVKGMRYSEVSLLENLPTVEIVQYGRDCFIEKEPTEEDSLAAERGWLETVERLTSGNYQLVVLDEITIALYYKLLSLEQVVEALLARHPSTEVIMTGRYAPPQLIKISHLVTEMREIKHYYQQGVLSREGFDR